MLDRRSSVYRGGTREVAERAYYDDARAATSDGYVPVAEDWSVALGQQVLTVTYQHDPDQAPAVLEALNQVELTPTTAERGTVRDDAAPIVSVPISNSRPNQSVPVTGTRIGVWIVTIICAAGFVWAWAVTGAGDVEIKAIVTFFIGIIWSGIVIGVTTVLVSAGLLGRYLFRGK